MKKLAEHNPTKLIDLLTERLAFERAGVKLYDAVVAKVRASNDPGAKRMLATVEQYRDQEKEHEEWLESQIRALGGDAHGKTEHSELILRESKGIEEVVLKDGDVTHVFHALLAAELVDNDGWDLLIELADDAGDDEALREFEQRKAHEEDHLAFVREANLATARRHVLGVQGSPLAAP